MRRKANLTVHIKANLVRKNGRKRIILPDNAVLPQLEPDQNEHLIHVVLRAHKWQKLISAGKVKTAEELAAQLGMGSTYICRVLRLNLLSPEIKRAILDGRQPKGLRVIDLLQPFPILWADQRAHFGIIQPYIY